VGHLDRFLEADLCREVGDAVVLEAEVVDDQAFGLGE
jgi:hypothetical protein